MPKPLPLILLLIPFCIACNRYQYSTISSSQLDKNDVNELVFENDSLKLVYNFTGPDLGPGIFIENKLTEPVYVDWRESALIVNGRTYSYSPIEVDPGGYVLGSSSASRSSTIDYISPRGTLNKTPLVINQSYVTTIPGAQMIKTRYNAGGFSYPVKIALFTEATSPLRFRSFISYMVGSSNSDPVSFENSFYVSSVMNAKASPNAIMQNGNHGNQFFTTKHSGGGAAAVAAGAALTGAIVAGVIQIAAVLIER